MHRTWVEIDEQALISNVKTLRVLSSGARFCAVVKGNAYGHGLKEVAQIVGRAGVNAFAVDDIEDAFLLRELFPSALILQLGYILSDRYAEAIRQGIELTLYDREGIEHAQRTAAITASTVRIHLKIETGTSRQGVLFHDIEQILALISRSKNLFLSGVSTHFANIEDTTNPDYASTQFALFSQAIQLVIKQG